MINKTGKYTFFSIHMKHSLKRNNFLDYEVSANFKRLKSHAVYSLATVELR